jgi:hypothetical protein
VVATHRRLELGLNDLFDAVRSYLNHSLVIRLACFGNPKNMLTRWNGIENHAPRAANATLTLVVDINLGAGWRHHH